MARLAPLWQAAGSYSAQLDRQLMAALWPSGGVNGGTVTATNNTMNISAAAGFAAVPLATGQGSALCRWDAPELVALSASPPSGQNRLDLVTVQVRDNAIDAGVNNDFIVTVVTGSNPGTNPPLPATPANALAIASVLVIGASANLNGAVITDLRPGALAVPLSMETMLTSVTGPAAPQSGQGEFGIAVANFAAVAGRAYRATGHILVAVSSGVGRCVSRLTSTGGVVPFASTYLVAGVSPVPPNMGQAGTAVVWARATASGNGQITLAIAGDGTAVASVGANAGRVLIEDMGPWPAGATVPTAEETGNPIELKGS